MYILVWQRTVKNPWVMSRTAAVVIQVPEAIVSLGGDMYRYKVEDVDLGCGAASLRRTRFRRPWTELHINR